MIYGKKKIGKTSFANQFSNNMFHMMYEPMARTLPIFQRSCETHADTVGYCDLLKDGEHDFDAVSVDPLPLAFQKALTHVCEKNDIEHPSDANDYGKTWGKCYAEFEIQMHKLLHSNLGVIFHAHEAEKEMETREGKKYNLIVPEGTKQVWDFINTNIENIWYYHMRGNKRFLQLRGDDYAFACTAWPDKFYTPDGRQVLAVPMGASPEEGYKNLLKAFNNEQEETYGEDEEPKKSSRKKRRSDEKQKVARRKK